MTLDRHVAKHPWGNFTGCLDQNFHGFKVRKNDCGTSHWSPSSKNIKLIDKRSPSWHLDSKEQNETKSIQAIPKLESYMDHHGSIKNIRHPFNEVLPEKSGQIMANLALKKAAPHFPWQLPSASEQEMVIGTKRHERWASPTPRLRRGRKLNEWNLNAPMRLTARLQTRQRIANMRFKVEVICHRSNLEDYTIAYPQPRGVQPPWPEKLPLGLTCWVSDHRQTSYERMLYPFNTKSNIKKPCLGRSLASQQGIQKVSNSLRCTAVPYFIRQ